MPTIHLDKIIVYPEQRELRQNHISYLADKIQRQGYNPSYPITLDSDNGLVDGGHRIAAARIVGLIEVPCLYLNGDTRRIYHAIRCNEDGADTQKYDVFDYAELCWLLNDQAEQELGWNRVQVSQYQNIKAKLHSKIWGLSRNVTNNSILVASEYSDLVTSDVTKVTWRETYFRAMLSHLPYTDHATYRGQRAVIEAAIERFGQADKKVTAKWIGEIAERQAWHIKLAQYMRDTLIQSVELSDRKNLLKNIKKDVFGDKPKDKDFDKFAKAIAALNEKILGIQLYEDDALQFIHTIADKSISLVIADPPYNVTEHEWDKVGTAEEYLTWLAKWLEIIKPKLTDDYHLFLFCSPEYQARIEAILTNNWPLKSRIIWEHRNLVKGREVADKYICNWEMVFHCGTHSLNFPPIWDDTRFQVKEYARPQSNFEDKSYHPTAKPLELIKLFIEHGSKPGDFILDSFAGGGTTGEASKNLGQRRCILVEKDKEYCTIIENRLGIKRQS